MPRGRKKTVSIEVLQSYDPSPMSMKAVGVKEDQTKERRWVSRKRIDERKNVNGYAFVTKDDSDRPDKQVWSKGMALMERSRQVADESAMRKQIRTIQQNSATKEDFNERIEKLSRHHGKNLHKNMFNEE